nr:Conserved oligomeric Golgi complex subunit [Polyrhizophydium stewartii]
MTHFRDYSAAGFEPAAHATRLVSGDEVDISEVLGRLSYSIDFLNKRINEQVVRHYGSLLNQVNELNSTEAAMAVIRQRHQALQQSFGRIKSRLTGQYTQIQQCHQQIVRAQALNETLRQVDRFLRLVARLDVDMAAGSSEYAKTALHVFELESILAETDLSGIVAVDRERPLVAAHKDAIETHARKTLGEGLVEQGQAKVAEALQIYSNLGVMPARVKALLDGFVAGIVKEMHRALDMISLNAEMKETQQRTTSGGGVRRVNEPASAVATSNVAVWANILWTRTERLTDAIYADAVKLYLLGKVLARKRDPITHISFLDQVVELLGGDLTTLFWQAVSQNLDKELRLATKASQFLLQVLQAGYPRFMRIFHDLFTRVSLVSGSVFNESEKSSESQMPLKILSSFESAYVSRSLTRLLDTVNAAFPEKPTPGQRMTVSRDDVDKIVRTVSSELDVAKFDGHLLRLAAKNIHKALNMYTVKCEHLTPTDASAYQIGVSITGSQQLSIDILNCVAHLEASVWRLLEDFEGTAADAPLTESLNNMAKLMQNVVEPLFQSFAVEFEAVASKMHREDYASQAARVPTGRSTETSVYFAELSAKLKWVAREILGRLQCDDDTREWAMSFSARVLEIVMRHASMTRPVNEQGKLRIAADMTQLEYLLNQIIGAYDLKLDADMVEAHRTLRAFRHLLFIDLAHIPNTPQLAHLSPVLVIHQILVRAHPVIPLPTQVFGWSETEYSVWLDSHTTAQALDALDKCLGFYVQDVTRRGETQYCIEYPVARSLLTLYLKQYADA